MWPPVKMSLTPLPYRLPRADVPDPQPCSADNPQMLQIAVPPSGAKALGDAGLGGDVHCWVGAESRGPLLSSSFPPSTNLYLYPFSAGTSLDHSSEKVSRALLSQSPPAMGDKWEQINAQISRSLAWLPCHYLLSGHPKLALLIPESFSLTYLC